MNKTELVNIVAEKVNFTKKDATIAVDEIFAAITEALKQGDKVQLMGFGTFEVRERAARTGINPRTQEPLQIAATKVPAFKPGKSLREEVK